MLDVTFKYKKQISNCINNSVKEFYILGQKHCEEYKELAEKQRTELKTIMDSVEEETSELSSLEQAKICKNLEEFIISLKRNDIR